MDYQNFQDVWMEVGCFIREHKNMYGTPQVKIYSDYVDVLFKVDSTLREWTQAGDERRIYAEDGYLVLGYTWTYDPQK